jgi:hypothetical protein
LLFSLKHASLQAPHWHGRLRQVGFVSTAVATTYRPIRRAVLIGVIGVIGRGGWGRGLHSGRWSSFSVGGILLTHHLFFIEVTEDDDLAVVRRPEDTAAEIAKKSHRELLIPQGIRDETFLIQI